MIDAAQVIVSTLGFRHDFRHPLLGEIDSDLFVHFMGELVSGEPGELSSKSATFVQPNVLCNSATGTGTCARLALMHFEGNLTAGQTLETISLGGSRLLGTLTDTTRIGGQEGISCTTGGLPEILSYADVVIDLDNCSVPAGDLDALFAESIVDR